MTDIFTNAKEKVVPQWMRFTNDGDSVQGTYINKILGMKDSYGNEQIVYQLLKEDGSITNVGFGLNKKFFNKDMETIKFGQIIGIKYKGKVSVKDKRTGKMVEVKDFGLFQDPKIVNEVWLKDNQGNMPTVTVVTATEKTGDFGSFESDNKVEDVPFSSPSSLTNEDKLAVIEKLAKDKLGATDSASVKDKVMNATGIAFIPLNYQKIIDTLAALAM